MTSPLPFLTSAIFVVITLQLNHRSPLANFPLAVAIWLIAPLSLILTNAAFMKLHRVFVASCALGWLVKLVQNRYNAGLVSYLNVVYAEQALLQNEQSEAQVSGQQLIATVVLVKALGGGWEDRLHP